MLLQPAYKKTWRKEVRGFTLVELMVSVSIVTVIMLVVLFSYGMFSDNLALSSAGQELSIGIRKAQTYGLAVKEVAVGGGQFNSAYGISFNPTDAPNEYDIFVDKNENGIFDIGNGCGGSNTECIEKFVFRNGIAVSNICNNSSCPPSGARSMQIVFLRPNPDATINFVTSGGAIIGSPATGKVVLISPKGKTSTITILSTSQISIQ